MTQNANEAVTNRRENTLLLVYSFFGYFSHAVKSKKVQKCSRTLDVCAAEMHLKNDRNMSCAVANGN